MRIAHRRSDQVLIGAFVAIALAALSSPAYHLYTDQIHPFLASVQQPQTPEQSAVELADAQMAHERQCLADALYYEARGEGVDGQVAVAEVVLRRTRDRNYPTTICGVVYEGADKSTGCQFSFTCDGSIKKPREAKAWDRAAMVADKILNGMIRLKDSTSNAIAFHSVNVSPVWAASMVPTRQIGNHIFYRWRTRAERQMAEAESTVDTVAADGHIDGVSYSPNSSATSKAGALWVKAPDEM